MLGYSICSLLIRSFISLARPAPLPDATSFICKSVRRLGTAPSPISGQSRPAAWPRPGRQMNRPLSRSANAQHFHLRPIIDKGVAPGNAVRPLNWLSIGLARIKNVDYLLAEFLMLTQ